MSELLVNNVTFGNNSTTNDTQCHPILFNLGSFSIELNPTEQYGICPDAITTVIFSSILLGLFVFIMIINVIGIWLMRRNGHVKSRDPYYLFVCIGVHAVFVIGFLLRYTISRKLFSCGVYTLL